MTRSSIKNGTFALVGAAALVVDLRDAPVPTGIAALLFATVLWLELRRQVEQHRRTRRHRLRRQIGTAALVAAGLWVMVSLVRALRDAFSGTGDAVQAGGQLVDAPWPGTFLVAGLGAIAAIALVTLAAAASRRRHSADRTPARQAAGENR